VCFGWTKTNGVAIDDSDRHLTKRGSLHHDDQAESAKTV
jgi:phosphohistidine phosphatase SixA